VKMMGIFEIVNATDLLIKATEILSGLFASVDLSLIF